MNCDHQLFGKIAGLLATLGFLPYVIAILRGQIQPSKASWTIWAVIGVALAISYKTAGANASIWVPVSYAICPVIILALVFYKDRSRMSAWPITDRVCLIVGLILFVPWLIFKLIESSDILPAYQWILPLITLYGGIAVDGFGAAPTILKSWKNPEGESVLAWTFWTAGNLLNLLAIETWSWNVASYAVYMALPAVLILPSLYLYQIKIWHKNKN